MKQLYIFLLLFSLVMGRITVLDLLKGIGFSETMQIFVKSVERAGVEDYLLLLVLFLPLLVSSIRNLTKAINRRRSGKAIWKGR